MGDVKYGQLERKKEATVGGGRLKLRTTLTKEDLGKLRKRFGAESLMGSDKQNELTQNKLIVIITSTVSMMMMMILVVVVVVVVISKASSSFQGLFLFFSIFRRWSSLQRNRAWLADIRIK